ncbi:uncharacterized protein TEOVI_000450100 [Trypanosoma equiperdum]|uniref:Uncharacterized protein n=2 Tax=Trypanozoon TaxID=39700 RepID=Q386U1_TRYB2|nr:hypothetical protein, conserved [Trypanosoma brucei brucei TREU927]EAN79190.1 hypothetical protein, conserved [Trypanosoma brucei brucei TREU927]SCU72917.1 hypothetical protein, conserved [Trypanosoma equiperdum]
MPSASSGYTFADFLRRLERSPDSHMAPLYHEHRELFVRRHDMFARVISSVTWSKGVALVAAAGYTQAVNVTIYRALLARMLLHNRHVRQCGAGSVVPWSAALRTYSEAIATHGNAVPTRMTLSALRLCTPARQWVAAISLLMLSQANDKLTLPMLIDAAGCCATPAAWEKAMTLLGRFHAQSLQVLPDSIQSLRPVGTSASTVDAAAHALLPRSEGPTPEQKHILTVINKVVSAVPWQVALSNEMCRSYLTHLVASTTLRPTEKTASLTTAVQQLPWEAFVTLMKTVTATVQEGSQGVLGSRSTPQLPPPQDGMERGDVAKSLLSNSIIREGVNLLQSEPETAIPFITTILHKLPSAEAAALFLSEATSAYRNSSSAVVAAAIRHPVVVGALLKRCADSNSWYLAASIFKSTSPTAIPCDVASDLVIQMRRANQAPLVVDVLQKYIVPSRTKLTEEAIEAALLCVLVHNRALAKASAVVAGTSPDNRTGKPNGIGVANGVHWISALSWATDLLEEGVESRILQTGTTPSVGGVNHEDPTVLLRKKTLSPRILSLLIYICVNAGSPRGGLFALGYARTVSKTELELSEEITALLYCMMYDRPREAESIIQHAVKKHGEYKGKYLGRLLVASQEAKGSALRNQT